eukprot:scaffold21505_cov28-Tisochrysis_lutea.AAC.4
MGGGVGIGGGPCPQRFVRHKPCYGGAGRGAPPSDVGTKYALGCIALPLAVAPSASTATPLAKAKAGVSQAPLGPSSGVLTAGAAPTGEWMAACIGDLVMSTTVVSAPTTACSPATPAL